MSIEKLQYQSLLPKLFADEFQLEVEISSLGTASTSMWLRLGLILLRGVLPLVVHQESLGKNLEYSYFTLESLDKVSVENFPAWATSPLQRYLRILPGYKSKREAGEAIAITAIEKHEYIRNQIPCLRLCCKSHDW